MSAAAERIGIRDKRVVTAAEVEALLGRQVADDARRAGWLRPCVVKANERFPRPFFRMVDVRAVEDRMAEGEYPGQVKGGGL